MGKCRGDFPTYIGTSIKSSEKELEKLKKAWFANLLL